MAPETKATCLLEIESQEPGRITRSLGETSRQQEAESGNFTDVLSPSPLIFSMGQGLDLALEAENLKFIKIHYL
jgi:hypothetical protein